MSERLEYAHGSEDAFALHLRAGRKLPIALVVRMQLIESQGGRIEAKRMRDDAGETVTLEIVPKDGTLSRAEERSLIDEMRDFGLMGGWRGYRIYFFEEWDVAPVRRNPTITHARPDARRGVASPALRGASVQTILQRPSNYDPAHLTQVLRPADVARLVAHLGALDQEVSLVLALDQRKRVIAVHEAGKGGADSVPLSRRTLVKVPLLAGARGVVTVHNHPSGDAMPSKADIRIARARAASLQCAGLELLDSIVIGSNRYQSLREMKLLPGAKLAGGKYKWSK